MPEAGGRLSEWPFASANEESERKIFSGLLAGGEPTKRLSASSEGEKSIKHFSPPTTVLISVRNSIKIDVLFKPLTALLGLAGKQNSYALDSGRPLRSCRSLRQGNPQGLQIRLVYRAIKWLQTITMHYPVDVS